jgi:hypothetical protein
MFEAEIKNKLKNDEDRLTSYVFGTLEIADRNLVLGTVFSDIGIDIKHENLENLTFRYWEKYSEGDLRVPDVIIEGSNLLIFVENKLDSSVLSDQLIEEFKDGSKHKDNFYLLCLTKDRKEPPEIDQVRSALKVGIERIKWGSWWWIYDEIQNILKKQGISNESSKLLNKLLKLLEEKEFVRFRGLNKEILIRISGSPEMFRTFFNDIPLLINELSDRLEEFNIESRRSGMAYFHRDGRITHMEWPDYWVHTFCTFAFADKKWDLGKFDYSGTTYLFVRFYLERHDSPIEVGYSIGPLKKEDGIEFETELTDEQKKRAWDRLIADQDVYVASISKWYHSECDYAEKLNSVKPAQIKFNKDQRLEFFHKIAFEEIDKPELVNLLVNKIVFWRNIVDELNLLPEGRGEVEEVIEEETSPEKES